MVTWWPAEKSPAGVDISPGGRRVFIPNISVFESDRPVEKMNGPGIY